jgi:hypothetical protein
LQVALGQKTSRKRVFSDGGDKENVRVRVVWHSVGLRRAVVNTVAQFGFRSRLAKKGQTPQLTIISLLLNVQARSAAHSTFCSIVAGISFPGVKAAGA